VAEARQEGDRGAHGAVVVVVDDPPAVAGLAAEQHGRQPEVAAGLLAGVVGHQVGDHHGVHEPVPGPAAVGHQLRVQVGDDVHEHARPVRVELLLHARQQVRVEGLERTVVVGRQQRQPDPDAAARPPVGRRRRRHAGSIARPARRGCVAVPC
jgi:hypothetical protein